MAESSTVCDKITRFLQTPSTSDEGCDPMAKVVMQSKALLSANGLEHSTYELKIAQIETPLVLHKKTLTRLQIHCWNHDLRVMFSSKSSHMYNVYSKAS